VFGRLHDYSFFVGLGARVIMSLLTLKAVRSIKRHDVTYHAIAVTVVAADVIASEGVFENME
jgi:hypothetical protein